MDEDRCYAGTTIRQLTYRNWRTPFSPGSSRVSPPYTNSAANTVGAARKKKKTARLRQADVALVTLAITPNIAVVRTLTIVSGGNDGCPLPRSVSVRFSNIFIANYRRVALRNVSGRMYSILRSIFSSRIICCPARRNATASS